jgi:hypothetical protein
MTNGFLALGVIGNTCQPWAAQCSAHGSRFLGWCPQLMISLVKVWVVLLWVIGCGCAWLVRGLGAVRGRVGSDGGETGCELAGLVRVYSPLPCRSRPVTRGVYRGSGPPLPMGLRAGAGSGGPGSAGGRPLPLYPSPSVAAFGGGCGARVAPAGTAASRSARRYPARLTPSTLTCRPERWTPARSSSSARRSGV